MPASLFIDIFNFLTSIVNDLGYLGIFIGMAIESSLFPLPSEFILIPAGALVARGEMNFLLVFLAGLGGTIFGALINFFLAMFLGRGLVDLFVKKYGKFLFITEGKLKKMDDFFIKHGEITVFIGRLIPVARHVVSLSAGFSGMNIFKFTLYTALGGGLWAFLLIYAGYLFGNKLGWINGNINLFYIVFLIIAIVTVIVYLSIRKRSPKN